MIISVLKTPAKLFAFSFVFVLTTLLAVVSNAQPFTPGRVVVLVVGDPLTPLSTAAASVQLQELLTTAPGTGVAISLPSTGTQKITCSGLGVDGMMTLSAERDRLIIPGYDAATGATGVATSTSASVNRELFMVAKDGTYNRAAYSTTGYDGGEIRSGTASGSNFFSSGPVSGLMLYGTSPVQLTATPTDTRVIQIFNGQTYFSSNSAGFSGISKLGTGIPVTSGSASSLIMPVATSPFGFSISPDSNILYVADDVSGITRYTRSGSSYTVNYVVNITPVRGLTVDYSGSNPVLYATTAETTGNSVIKITDAGASSLSTNLVTATSAESFRGIAFAPTCAASISLTGPSTICSGDSTSFVIKGNPSGSVVYRINGGTPHTVTIGVNGSVQVSSGALTTNSIIGLTTITTPACPGVAITGSVAVSVNPTPAVITGTGNICVGGTLALNDATLNGTWSSSNATTATIGTSGIVTAAAIGTTTISYTLATTCYVTRNVTVSTLPPAITGSMVVCVGSSTTLANTTTGGTWSSSNTATAAVGSSNGIVTGVGTAASTVTISYLAGSACLVTTEMTVYPAVAAVTGPGIACMGSTITLADVTSGGTWISGSPTVATISTSGVVTPVTTGTSRISYLAPGGCSATKVVTASPLPAVITGPDSVCTGASVVLSSATFAAGTWSSLASPAIATVNTTSGNVAGISPGTARVTYTITNTGCYRSVVVTVNQTPAVITGANVVCKGSNITLTDATSGGIWTSSNNVGASIGSLSGIVTGVNAGTTRITYIMSTGCRQTMPLTINPIPAVITGITRVCVGSSVTLSDISPGGSWSKTGSSAVINAVTGLLTGVSAGTVTAFYTFATGCAVSRVDTVDALPGAITGDTTVCEGLTAIVHGTPAGGLWQTSMPSLAAIGSTSGVVSGLSHGTSLITYTLPTGCKTVRLFTVNVSPVPVTGPTNICIGGPVVALNNVSGGGLWTSANTATVTIGGGTGILTAVSAGSAQITYSLYDGCFTTYNVTANITPAAITGSPIICQGITAIFGDVTTGGTWSSGNATISVDAATGAVTGALPGTGLVTYSMPSGCSVTYPMLIKLAPALITGPVNFCMGTPGTLVDTSLGGSWSSSNISVATVGTSSGILSGVTAGTATISYTLLNGCSRTSAITLNPLPSAISGAGSVCVAASLPLSDATAGGTWSSSNEIIATVGSSSGAVVGVAPGTVRISYTLSTGCRISSIITVAVTPSVIAGPGILCKNSAVSLVNTAGGGVWTSSNTTVAMPGTSISTALCVLNGVEIGTATITYTIGACIATHDVSVSPVPSVIMGQTVVCSELTAVLYDSVAGGEWLSGNAGIASVGTSGIVTGNTAGTTPMTYAINAICQVYTTVTVNQSAPFAKISVRPAGPLCSNTLYQNFGSDMPQPAGAKLEWTVLNAQLTNIGPDKQYSIVSFHHPGEAIVMLSSQIPGTGCVRTDSFVTIIPGAIAPIPKIVYYSDALVFLDNTADYYQWGYDDSHSFDSTIVPNAFNQDYYLPTPDFANNMYWVESRHGECTQKTYFKSPTEVGPTITNETGIILYPNPTETILNVAIAGLDNNNLADLQITDMQGKTIYTSSLSGNVKIDVSKFTPGAYSLTVIKNGLTLGIRTFIKK